VNFWCCKDKKLLCAATFKRIQEDEEIDLHMSAQPILMNRLTPARWMLDSDDDLDPNDEHTRLRFLHNDDHDEYTKNFRKTASSSVSSWLERSDESAPRMEKVLAHRAIPCLLPGGELGSQTEYLVKFLGKSYLHVVWRRAFEIERQGWWARLQLRRYQSRLDGAQKEPWFDPALLVVDSVLDTCLINSKTTVRESQSELESAQRDGSFWYNPGDCGTQTRTEDSGFALKSLDQSWCKGFDGLQKSVGELLTAEQTTIGEEAAASASTSTPKINGSLYSFDTGMPVLPQLGQKIEVRLGAMFDPSQAMKH
jgi:hypothetical protein